VLKEARSRVIIDENAKGGGGLAGAAPSSQLPAPSCQLPGKALLPPWINADYGEERGDTMTFATENRVDIAL